MRRSEVSAAYVLVSCSLFSRRHASGQTSRTFLRASTTLSSSASCSGPHGLFRIGTLSVRVSSRLPGAFYAADSGAVSSVNSGTPALRRIDALLFVACEIPCDPVEAGLCGALQFAHLLLVGVRDLDLGAVEVPLLRVVVKDRSYRRILDAELIVSPHASPLEQVVAGRGPRRLTQDTRARDPIPPSGSRRTEADLGSTSRRDENSDSAEAKSPCLISALLCAPGDEVRLGEILKNRQERGREGVSTLSVPMNHGVVDRDTIDTKMSIGLSLEEHLLVHPGYIVCNEKAITAGKKAGYETGDHLAEGSLSAQPLIVTVGGSPAREDTPPVWVDASVFANDG